MMDDVPAIGQIVFLILFVAWSILMGCIGYNIRLEQEGESDEDQDGDGDSGCHRNDPGTSTSSVL